MAFMNYSGSLRYDMNGRKRKAYKKNNPTPKKRRTNPVRSISASELQKKETQIRNTTDKIPSASPSMKGTGKGTGVDIKWQQEKLKISSGYTVAPAYNKGAYQVIGKNNIKDIGK